SQYTQLIARRVREQKVYCEIHPFNYKLQKVLDFNPKGIILSGSPSSVFDKNSPKCDDEIFKLNLPVLGICYGLQLMTTLFGGRVAKSQKREFGRAFLKIISDNGLFNGIKSGREKDGHTVWMSHGDQILKLPEDFKVIAKTDTCPYAAIKNRDGKIFGVQFHPEVVHTSIGKKVLRNFLFDICKCKPLWNMKSFITSQTENIRKAVRNKKVILALSGGVDSSVAAVLLHRAIGKNLNCVFVDNGVLRANEASQVVKRFKNNFHINLKYIDAGKEFLKDLKGVTDPEKKRKIIGKKFIRVFEREARKLGKIEFLSQGTLYPDVIESVSFKGPSATIKSHHNVGGLPEDMKLKLIEPFRELFKDEVRLVGKELGLPDEVIWRQPFPGPGLAVRILGEVTEERLKILREADTIVVEEIKKAGLYRKIWQSFAVLLPVKSVGVMGDERTYENAVGIRAVSSLDGMTADWIRLPYDLMARISNRIINEVKGVNRVVYDISSKPPSTIEWE
ncbi:MAG: glutamine-hydrolyzing GMP synthase, partial [Candidatus Schekmanbacteria bacterium RBG_16_38_10]